MQILQIETKKETFSKREVGVEFLKIDISRPYFANREENDTKVAHLNDFYGKVTENCKKYAETELFDKIRAEYDSDPDPRKRFHFKKYVYRYQYTVTEHNDAVLCVCIDVSLLRGGRREKYKRMAQVWDMKTLGLCPPKKKKGKSLNAPDGYYIMDGKEVLYSHTDGYREEILE